MKKIIRLTESDLVTIVKSVISENSSKKCLPKSYTPGTRYGRDELTKIFLCYIKNKDKYPFSAVREWMFPKLPNGMDNQQDPMRMIIMGQRTPLTMEQIARTEERDTRNVTMRVTTVDPIKLSAGHSRWFGMKQNSENFKERLMHQIEKIRENNYDTLVVTPEDEPLVFQSVDGKLDIMEGWHRYMAIMFLLENNEISPEDAKVLAVTVYRNSSYNTGPKMDKPMGLF